MIIRLSFGDNDITNYFEEFCKGLRNKMFTMDDAKSYNIMRENYDSVESYCEALNDFWDKEKTLKEIRYYLMNPENQFKKDSKEHKQIIEEVLRLWRIYAPTVEMDGWGDPDVFIQYELKEQWENGEATYYWTAYDTCITQ
jgi:hypothetical protein